MARNTEERSGTPPKSGTVSGFRDSFKKAVTELLILQLLGRSNMYAYEMQREIERQSGGVLAFNTLYLAIYRLQSFGFIEECGKETVDGRERTYYGITESGRNRFVELTVEYQRLTHAVEKVLLMGGPGHDEESAGQEDKQE